MARYLLKLYMDRVVHSLLDVNCLASEVGANIGWMRVAERTMCCNFVVVVSIAGTASNFGNYKVGFAGHKLDFADKNKSC